MLMKDCRDTLTKVRKHKYAWVFGKPVDPVALHIPDYFDIIKEPMDFGTIKERLDKKQYATAGDFAYDMRLVFDNCALYNTADSDAGLMGNVLRQEFEAAWIEGRLEEKISEEEEIRANEDEIIRNTPNDPIEDNEAWTCSAYPDGVDKVADVPIEFREKRLKSGFSSRFVGVCWNKKMKKWVTQRMIGSKNYRVGYFQNEEEAAQAYIDFALKHRMGYHKQM